jgi:DeoR/GlpR family transcriptional regulator of sugar metabolism
MPSRTTRLTQADRHARILAMLRREGIVRIATLAQAFGVTTETARRDLDELARSGAIKRTYGGGASASLVDEPGIGIRGKAHAAERASIAAAAAELVEAGDALMIDAGSTTSLFAAALAARNLRVTVLTNCLPVAIALGGAERSRVILCPGELVMREGGVFGPEARQFVARYKANKAFIGAGGIDAEGFSDADSAACAIKRAMMARADATLLLADSSKLGVAQFETIAPLASLAALVSDAAPPRALASRLRKAGVDVIVA